MTHTLATLYDMKKMTAMDYRPAHLAFDVQ